MLWLILKCSIDTKFSIAANMEFFILGTNRIIINTRLLMHQNIRFWCRTIQILNQENEKLVVGIVFYVSVIYSRHLSHLLHHMSQTTNRKGFVKIPRFIKNLTFSHFEQGSKKMLLYWLSYWIFAIFKDCSSILSHQPIPWSWIPV